MSKELEMAKEAAKIFKDYNYTYEETMEIVREICGVEQ